MMHGWTIAECFVERGVSGSVPLADRPEDRRLLATVTKLDIIITPKLDRAANCRCALFQRLWPASALGREALLDLQGLLRPILRGHSSSGRSVFAIGLVSQRRLVATGAAVRPDAPRKIKAVRRLSQISLVQPDQKLRKEGR
jgi:hypothetical protein